MSEEIGTDAAPIGRVTFLEGSAVATLAGGNRWQVAVDGEDQPDLAASLAAQYEGFYEGPSDGAPGEGALIDLARHMDGTIEWLGGSRPARGPEVVY